MLEEDPFIKTYNTQNNWSIEQICFSYDHRIAEDMLFFSHGITLFPCVFLYTQPYENQELFGIYWSSRHIS